jgi:hypothetical protein
VATPPSPNELALPVPATVEMTLIQLFEGAFEGTSVGASVGSNVGASEGAFDGFFEGTSVGASVGLPTHNQRIQCYVLIDMLI